MKDSLYSFVIRVPAALWGLPQSICSFWDLILSPRNQANFLSLTPLLSHPLSILNALNQYFCLPSLCQILLQVLQLKSLNRREPLISPSGAGGKSSHTCYSLRYTCGTEQKRDFRDRFRRGRGVRGNFQNVCSGPERKYSK